ncbi:MAG: hypothetical protein HW421_2982 [Ignavibacteria bacterium]|nr:hypothetical protein [Ignavibacteria bacterium]
MNKKLERLPIKFLVLLSQILIIFIFLSLIKSDLAPIFISLLIFPVMTIFYFFNFKLSFYLSTFLVLLFAFYQQYFYSSFISLNGTFFVCGISLASGIFTGYTKSKLLQPERIKSEESVKLPEGIPLNETQLSGSDGSLLNAGQLHFENIRLTNLLTSTIEDKSALAAELEKNTIQNKNLNTTISDQNEIISDLMTKLQNIRTLVPTDGINYKELTKSEERLRNIFEKAPIGIYRTTPDGKFILANSALAQILRYPSLEILLNHNLETQIYEPGYKRADFKERIERDGFVHETMVEWTRFDNTKVFIQEHAWLIRDEDDDPVFYDGIIEDVSERYMADNAFRRNLEQLHKEIVERKQIEKTLKESEERFRFLVESAGIAILIDDPEGNFVYFNNRFSELFGYDSGELIMMKVGELVHPEDAETIKKYHFLRISGSEAPSRYEFTGVRKDGSLVFIETEVCLEKQGNEIVGTRSYFWDISQRKILEKQRDEQLEKYSGVLTDMKTLTGVIPICTSCKKLRDENNNWHTIEDFITKFSLAQLSHGVCPDCATTIYPEYE